MVIKAALKLLVIFFPLILACHAEERRIVPAPAFDASALVELPTRNWPTNGGDYFNRRYSPLTEINRQNVGEMKAVWRVHLDGSGIGPQYSGEAQPIVYEGTIYIVTGANDVFAVSIDTGEIVWSYKANLDPDIDTICCGWASRGLAIGDGNVYVGQLDGKLIALDQGSGEVVWSVQAERWDEGLTITSAPLYFDGKVITGFAGAEFGVRGRVKAYSAKDGSHVWTFYTIPAPRDTGSETWPADTDAWKYGGATVWQTPAVDPELGLIYFSTGNPGPDLNGAVREGDNLFTTSIVAIDADSGEYRWHFQQVHHDIWDLDAANPVILFDTEYDGRLRKGVVQISKTGWAYILDRTNGEPLIGIEERPVMQDSRQLTSPTQPFPVGDSVAAQTIDIPPEGFGLLNEAHTFTPFWKDPVVTRRSGTNWPPSAYDPVNGTLFVCAREYLLHFSVDDEEEPELGERYDGGTFGNLPFSNGIVAAFDITTNRAIWRQRWPDTCYGGVAATASGLLFMGRNDGRVTALDATNGERLWEFQTDAGVNAPISVFEYKGEQHLAVYSAGNMFVGSVRGDSLWLFSLAGELDETPPPSSGSATTTKSRFFAERGLDNTDGQELFANTCQFCHGKDGQGSENGVNLIESRRDDLDTIRYVVANGRNGMPAFKASMTEQQIDAVARYVLELQGQNGE